MSNTMSNTTTLPINSSEIRDAHNQLFSLIASNDCLMKHKKI